MWARVKPSRDAIKLGLLGKRARSCFLRGGRLLREVVITNEAMCCTILIFFPCFAYLKSDLQLTADLDLCFSTNKELL